MTEKTKTIEISTRFKVSEEDYKYIKYLDSCFDIHKMITLIKPFVDPHGENEDDTVLLSSEIFEVKFF